MVQTFLSTHFKLPKFLIVYCFQQQHFSLNSVVTHIDLFSMIIYELMIQLVVNCDT